MSAKLRVLVVDNSTTYRKIVRDALSRIPEVEVVGNAINGARGLEQIAALKPDLATLDIEMPEMDGLQLLQTIKSRGLETEVIMVSSLTSHGAQSTTEALRLGAFDFCLKPDATSAQENTDLLRADLEPMVNALLRRRGVSCKATVVNPPVRDDHRTGGNQSPPYSAPSNRISIGQHTQAPEIVMLGISTGGPAALSKMLPMLPASLSVPLLIVQHMPPQFTKNLASDLNRHCALEVTEARGGEKVQAGRVLIAPGGRHMKVARTPEGVFVRITDDAPVLSCRPSVDYLFRSVGQAYKNILAVIMTGMGDDGTRSLLELKSANLQVVSQDQASCTVYGMPRAIAESGCSDIVCPLDEIAGVITRATRNPSPPAHVSVPENLSPVGTQPCILPQPKPTARSSVTWFTNCAVSTWARRRVTCWNHG